jgi:AMP deaminase
MKMNPPVSNPTLDPMAQPAPQPPNPAAYNSTPFLQPSPSFPAQQARLPPALSAAEMYALSGRDMPAETPNQQNQQNHTHQNYHQQRRSGSFVTSPTALGGANEAGQHWLVSSSEPRIFPGLVSRSQRRDSMRQSSMSEKDGLGFGAGPAPAPAAGAGAGKEE